VLYLPQIIRAVKEKKASKKTEEAHVETENEIE
jgi:hypothetical protein